MVETDYVDFKEKFYDNDKTEFIKDVVSFANSFSNEPSRYIIFGIKEGKNSLEETFSDQILPVDPASLQQLIQSNVEPDITFSLYEYIYKGNNLLVLEITGFADKPYMIKKDYDRKLKQGEIYIRINSSKRKADRRHLDKMYREKGNNFNPQDIDIFFSSSNNKIEKFYVQDENIRDNFPSSIKKQELTVQLEELIQHKAKLSKYKDLPAKDLPNFDSNKFTLNKILVGFNKFGSPIYKSEEELRNHIENVHTIYVKEDKYYEFSVCAEQVNFCITNNGKEFLKDVEIKIFIPKKIGYVFEEYVSVPNYNDYINLPNLYLNGYPYVELVGENYVVTESFDRLRHQSTEDVYAEPLRILFNNSENSEIKCNYEISAENLPQPVKGELTIELKK